MNYMDNLLIFKLTVLGLVIVFIYITALTDTDKFYDRLEDEQAEDHLKRLTSTSKKDIK